jgi:hypothetical protein
MSNVSVFGSDRNRSGFAALMALSVAVFPAGLSATGVDQQLIGSRVILVTVSGTGSRPLVNLEPDDFVVDEGGQAREILSLHVADYPLVVLVDNTSAAERDLDAIREAAARFISRVGARAIAVGTLTDPTITLASFEDTRATVLQRIKDVSAVPTASPLVLQAAANGARLIRENGSPFSAIVVISARAVSASQATDREFLTPILDSRAVVYVIANRPPAPPGAPPEGRCAESPGRTNWRSVHNDLFAGVVSDCARSARRSAGDGDDD